jgi:hypothetical protein
VWAVSLSVFDIWCNHYIAFLWFPFPGYFPCWVFFVLLLMFMRCFLNRFFHLISPIILILIHLSVFPFKRIIRGLSNFPLSEQNFCWFNSRVSNPNYSLTRFWKNFSKYQGFSKPLFIVRATEKNFEVACSLDTPDLIRRKFSVNENLYIRIKYLFIEMDDKFVATF